MIGRLTGQVLECSPGRVILDVGGVGYVVHIPVSTFYVLSSRNGTLASLHVHTHVRDDALQLFGFASPEEQIAFEQLIAISGVGPKMALGILSGIGVEELKRAVVEQDRVRLQKIPGVGKKTAERVLLELRDKIDDGTPTVMWAAAKTGPPRGGDPEALQDGISALVNLGYPRDVARRVVGDAIEREGKGATLERVLKTALGGLVR